MAARSGNKAKLAATKEVSILDAIEKLTFLASPHIESFDYWIDEGLQRSVEDLDPVDIATEDGRSITYTITDIKLSGPTVPSSLKGVADRALPTDCRQSASTYAGVANATIVVTTFKGTRFEITRPLGRIPIMVRAAKCWLHGLGPKETVAHNEDATEPGGYFIVNGNEKLVRLLIVPRRNYPMAVIRQAFQKRGKGYTKMGSMIRCCRPDQTSITNTIHFLSDGLLTFRFALRKQEFFLPVVLLMRALIDVSDREIYERIVQGDHETTFFGERAEMLLKDAKQFNAFTKRQALAFLGEKFRVTLGSLPRNLTAEEVGIYLLRRYVFVHLSDDRQKFDLLILMVRKSYALAQGLISEDNQDSPMHQEVLLGGHLYGMHFKEKVEEWMQGLKAVILKEIRANPSLEFTTEDYFEKALRKVADVGKKMEYFLATGNLKSESGLDLMQVTGYTIVAERLNYLRFLSHLRCIHREMKTTTVRKLIADNWGFLCPVHTPDGAPCGLLNHLSSTCKIPAQMPTVEDTKAVHAAVSALGMTQVGPGVVAPPGHIPVLLDGVVLGSFSSPMAAQAAVRLRHKKVTETTLNKYLEIAYIPPHNKGAFAGLYLFLCPARFQRPVRHLATNKLEFVGSLEQPYMNIACLDEDLRANTTHQEFKPTHILSVVANLTPFSDFNQSPRNMYQCQMGKQSMGTPVHCFPYRTDNKIYRIQTPQAPVARTNAQDEFHMDDYPNGTNAVVAVISYTGYDMEDAMIINKSSYERGFQHGTVYKTEIIDLLGKDLRVKAPKKYFGNMKEGKVICQAVDNDGLPHVGKLINPTDPLYTYFDETGKHFIAKYKGKEPAYIDQVRLIGEPGKPNATKAILKLRLNRNPVIGDKFSSRHGQKGVMSQLWPMENMPFSESGMTPDVIINPHAFPSRMTIGMLVESLAGKSGALHGIFQDSTPFKFGEKNTAVNYFGEQLLKAGYNYFGNEPMYSGIFGTEFACDIYIGVVYYQRLRHMVKDKYQVRATGPVHNLTRQPIKGRKLGGGIRFGEMERDSLLAHGASYLLHDRLMLSSDYHKAYVCGGCGSLLAPVTVHSSATSERKVTCRWCDTRKAIRVVALPFVFRYLAVELAAMNIRLTMQLSS